MNKVVYSVYEKSRRAVSVLFNYHLKGGDRATTKHKI
jgi:hypothetical protein